jgi:hypothetical protein
MNEKFRDVILAFLCSGGIYFYSGIMMTPFSLIDTPSWIFLIIRIAFYLVCGYLVIKYVTINPFFKKMFIIFLTISFVAAIFRDLIIVIGFLDILRALN